MTWSTGSFTRIHSWAADAAAGIDILASRMDQEDDNLAAGIDNCLAKDGQNSPTASLPMAGNRHTGAGIGQAHTDYPTCDQVQNNQFNWGGLSTGADNAYVLTGVGGIVGVGAGESYPSYPAAYPTGSMVQFKASFTNDDSATLSVNGGPAINIYNSGALMSGAEIVMNSVNSFIFDGTVWHLMSPPGEGAVIGYFPVGCRLQLTANVGPYSADIENLVYWPGNAANWDDGRTVGDPMFADVMSPLITIPSTAPFGDGRYQLTATLLAVPESSADVSHEAWFKINGGDFLAGGSNDVHASLIGAQPGVIKPQGVLELEAGDEISLVYKYRIFTESTFSLAGSVGYNNATWIEVRKVG
jgi:hypothetical protein